MKDIILELIEDTPGITLVKLAVETGVHPNKVLGYIVELEREDKISSIGHGNKKVYHLCYVK